MKRMIIIGFVSIQLITAQKYDALQLHGQLFPSSKKYDFNSTNLENYVSFCFSYFEKQPVIVFENLDSTVSPVKITFVDLSSIKLTKENLVFKDTMKSHSYFFFRLSTQQVEKFKQTNIWKIRCKIEWYLFKNGNFRFNWAVTAVNFNISPGHITMVELVAELH